MSPCCSTSSRITSIGTARSRRTPTRSCGSSRTRAAATWRSSRGVSSPSRARRRGSSLRQPTSCRPSRSSPAPTTGAARALGVDDATIAEALETFPGVAHRLEPVADANGVLYVNDSKATNTAAARRAVAAYDQPLHVILGGRGKGESYTELALDLAGRARRAYLIGEAARAMDVALELAGVDH